MRMCDRLHKSGGARKVQYARTILMTKFASRALYAVPVQMKHTLALTCHPNPNMHSNIYSYIYCAKI